MILRPAGPDDSDRIWRLLAPVTKDVTGMSSLPGSSTSAKQMCEDTAETVAALATGSFQLAEGQQRRLLFLLADGDDVVGLTGVTFKQSVPNLAVQVTTNEDGHGLIMSSSSVPWTRTELDSSYLGAPARGLRVGTLLSRGRFMMLHLVNSQIPAEVASHLRGRFDPDGSAPFWRCFGAHFAPEWENSATAERALVEDPTRLSHLANHVLPLTAPVLESLGAVNAASLPAFHMLRAEGLAPNGMYDPVDGGPTVRAALAETVTGRIRTHGKAAFGSAGDTDALVSVATVDRFRVTRARVTIEDGSTITMDPAVGAALDVSPGTLLVAVPL